MKHHFILGDGQSACGLVSGRHPTVEEFRFSQDPDACKRCLAVLAGPDEDPRTRAAMLMDGEEWEELAKHAELMAGVWSDVQHDHLHRGDVIAATRVEEFVQRWKRKAREYHACAALEQQDQTAYEESKQP